MDKLNLLSSVDVSNLIGMPPHVVTKMAKKGELPYIMLGGFMRFHEQTIEKIFEEML